MLFRCIALVVLFASPAYAQKYHCKAENHQIAVRDAHTKKVEVRDNWMAFCTLTVDGVDTTDKLVLPEFATRKEAMDAIDEWIAKKVTK